MMPNRLPIKRASICDLVIEEIKSAILNKEFLPGDKLPSEAELAQAYSVGRGSVREALKRLEMVGMVNIIHGKGVIVADQDSVQDRMRFLDSSLALSAPQLQEVMEARRIIEQAAVRLAAARATPDQLKKMEEVVELMERSLEAPGEFVNHDLVFHLTLAEASGNSLLPHFLESIRSLIKKQLGSTIRSSESAKQSNQHHQKVLRAVQKGDGDAAARFISKHIDQIEKFMMEHEATD